MGGNRAALGTAQSANDTGHENSGIDHFLPILAPDFLERCWRLLKQDIAQDSRLLNGGNSQGLLRMPTADGGFVPFGDRIPNARYQCAPGSQFDQVVI